MSVKKILKHCRHNSASTTSGGGDDGLSGCVFLTDCKGVGAYKTILSRFGAFVYVLLTIQHSCLSFSAKTTGQYASGFETCLDGFLHLLPDFIKEIPYLFTLKSLYVFGDGDVVFLAILADFFIGVVGVNFLGDV